MAPRKRGVFRQPRQDHVSDLSVSQTKVDQVSPCNVSAYDRSWYSTHNLPKTNPTDKCNHIAYWLYRNEVVEADLYKEKIIFLKQIQPNADLSSLINNTEAQNKSLFKKRTRRALTKRVVTKQIGENSVRNLYKACGNKFTSHHVEEFIYKPKFFKMCQSPTDINRKEEEPNCTCNTCLKDCATTTSTICKVATMSTCVGTDYNTSTAGTNTKFSRVATTDVPFDTKSSLLTGPTKDKNLKTNSANKSMKSDSSTTVAVEFFNQGKFVSSESLDSADKQNAKNTRKSRKTSRLPVPLKKPQVSFDKSTSDLTGYSTRQEETDETITNSSRTEQETLKSGLTSKFNNVGAKKCDHKSVQPGKPANTKTPSVFKIRPKISVLYRKKIKKPMRNLDKISEKFAKMKKNHSSKISDSKRRKYSSLPYKSDSHVLTMNPECSSHAKFWLVAVPNEHKNSKIPILVQPGAQENNKKKTAVGDQHQTAIKTSNKLLDGILPLNNQEVWQNPSVKLTAEGSKSKLKKLIYSNKTKVRGVLDASSFINSAVTYKEQPIPINIENNILCVNPHDDHCELLQTVNEKRLSSTQVRKWIKQSQSDILEKAKEKFTIGILIHNKHYYLAVDKITQTPTFENKIQRKHHTVKTTRVRSAKRSSKMLKLMEKETQMYEYLTPSEIYCRDWIGQNLFHIEDLNPHAIIVDRKISNDSTKSSMTSSESAERLFSIEFPTQISMRNIE